MPLTEIGGMSNAMALRSAAAYGYYAEEDDVAHASRAMMFTHRENIALEGGEFFARVAFRVIHQGLTPRQAIEQVRALVSELVELNVPFA